KGNLAIFFTGTAIDANGTSPVFSTANNTTFAGPPSGAPYQFFIVRAWQSGLCPTMPNPNISVSNSTSFNNLTLFVYSPCRIDFGNNKPGAVTGQFSAGEGNTTNRMVVNSVPLSRPAFNAPASTSGCRSRERPPNRHQPTQ